jgi:clan AA aspartic protease (TIGR02281 family)
MQPSAPRPDLKFSFSSGAPPVMSTVVMLPCCRISSTQRSAVALSIISVRLGELSTWQWVQAWLQYRPMLIWKMVAGARTSGAPAGGQRVVLTADSRGHFMSAGSINGKSVQFMVDTGATTVALSQADAQRLGLKTDGAQRVGMHTANGTVVGHQLKLQRVRLGDVEVSDVTAVILPQQMPYVLLGNSFLNRFQMQRDNDQMTLQRRY